MPAATRQIHFFLFLGVFALLARAQYGGYGGGYGGYASSPSAAGASASSTGSSRASETGEKAGESGEYGEYGGYGGYGEYSRISSRAATLAHAVCGALATMLFLPAGALIARSRVPRWFPVHAAWQLVLSAGLVCAAFGIAWAHFSGGLDTPHRRAAAALFALVIAQLLLGAGAHLIGPRAPRALKTRTGRSVLHGAHWGVGLAVVGLGWAVAYLGLTSEWEYRGHGHPSRGWRAGWGVVVGVWILLYAMGLGLLPRQLRRERERVAQERTAPETAAKHEGTPAPPELRYEQRPGF